MYLTHYADNNSLPFCDPHLEVVQTVIQEESEVAINWFTKNNMLPTQTNFKQLYLAVKILI